MDLSIIIPIYNAEKYLRKCLESLLEEEEIKYEIILVNDGSKDHSDLICKEYQRKKSEIFKYIENENYGCSYSRNYGMTKAKGRYIAFLDSDDFIDKNYFSKLCKLGIEKDLDIVIGGIRFLDQENYIKNEIVPKNLKDKKDFFNNLNFFNSPWNKIYKKKIIFENKIKFPENSHMGEDMSFVYKMYVVSEKIYGLEEEIFYNYFENKNGASYNLKKRFDIFKSFEDIIKNSKKLEIKVFNELFIKNAIILPLKVINQFKDSENSFKRLKKEILNFNEFFSIKTKLIILGITILGKNNSSKIFNYLLDKKIRK